MCGIIILYRCAHAREDFFAKGPRAGHSGNGMKKTLLTILTIALALSLCAAWTPALAQGTEAEGGANYELLLPENYEQYISLTDPTDFTLDEHYIAIADKPDASNAAIYLYSRAENIYNKYTLPTSGEISSLNLYRCDEGDFLLYIETGNKLHCLDLETMQPAQLTWNGSPPSVMQLSGNEIYYTIQTGTTSSLYYTTIDGLEVTAATSELDILDSSKPAFAIYGGTVYVSEGNSVRSCSPTAATGGYTTTDAIEYFAVAGPSNGDILYSNAGNRLYRGSDQQSFRDGCSVVKQYGGDFYVLSGDEILRYDIGSEDFDDYRIGKYSDAENRLGPGAAGISLFGQTLLVADTTNSRILVYDTKDRAYGASVTVGYDPLILCAGENSFAVSDGHALYIYAYGEESPKLSLPSASFSAQVVDIAYSYGNYYIVTGGNNNACIQSEESALSGKNTLIAGKVSHSPVSVAADLFGNIYVASEQSVYVYTETTFGKGGAGDLTCAFTAPPLKILSDYEGNIYALTGDSVYRYEHGTTYMIDSYAFGETFNDDAFVYSETALSALSFAFGYEDDTVYILSDGFIAAARGLNVSSLNNLSGTEAHGAVFDDLPDEAFAQNRLVTANAGTVCVGIGLSSLEEEAALLDCGEYYRAEEPRTGVALAETDYGVLALFYDEEVENEFVVTRTYELCLLLKGSGYTYPDAVQSPSYTAATLSNDAGLYKYPAMRTSAPTGEENDPYEYAAFCRLADLSKGTRVTVLSVLTPESGVLDCGSYAFVRCDGADGVRYGFVPESYLIPAAQTGSAGTTQFVWRNLERGASVTLANISDASDEITLENEELLRVLTAPDEDGRVLVSYAADGKEYRGTIDHELLVHPDPALAISILVLVPVVAAAVLLSACYLIFRKQPTLQ